MLNKICELEVSGSAWTILTDVGDEICWRQLLDVGDSLSRFAHHYPASFKISVGQQHPKDVTNIKILLSTSKTCHPL